MLGGIELGGTKVRCAVAAAPDRILDEIRIPTTRPAETLSQALAFLARHPVRSLGIASFGPLQVNPALPRFGDILATPKAHWSDVSLLQAFASLGVPMGLDTDVNAAALAEWRVRRPKPPRALAYVTIGTGIGAGILLDGRPVSGSLHGELGHIFVGRHPDDPFSGCCPFHGDCLEGLASGTAMAARWQKAAETLPADHPGWQIEAWYLAVMCVNIARTVAPDTIVLGGGVMQREGLLDDIRAHYQRLMGGYHGEPADSLAPPRLGGRSGLVGALLLAEQAGHRHGAGP